MIIYRMITESCCSKMRGALNKKIIKVDNAGKLYQYVSAPEQPERFDINYCPWCGNGVLLETKVTETEIG